MTNLSSDLPFFSAGLEQTELDAVLKRIDENLALRSVLREQPHEPPATAEAVVQAPPLDMGELWARLDQLRFMDAPLFVVKGRRPAELLKRLLNVPIKVFGYKQISFNRDLLELFQRAADQLQSLRQYAGPQGRLDYELARINAAMQVLTEQVVATQQALTTQVADQQRWLAQLTADVQGLNRWVEQIGVNQHGQQEATVQLSEQLQGQNAWIAQVVADQKGQQEATVQLGAQLQGQNTWIEQIVADQQGQQEAVTQLGAQLQGQNTWIAQVVADQQGQQEAVTQLGAQLQGQNTWIAQVVADQQGQQEATAQLGAQLQGQNAWIEQIVADHKGQQEATTQLGEQIRGQNEWITQVVTDQRAQQEAVTQLSAQLHGQNAWIEQIVADQKGQQEATAQLGAQLQGQNTWIEQVLADQRGQSEWINILQRKVQMLALDVRERVAAPADDEHIPEPRIVNPEQYTQRLAAMGAHVRVNLGSGEKPLAGYLNVDFRAMPEVDVVADVRRLPFEPESLAEIAAAHLVEHFREHQFRAHILPYWRGLLRPDGALRIVCPDWAAMLRRLNDGSMALADFKLLTFGGQDYEGDDHFAMYAPETLAQLLRESGFARIEVLATDRMNGLCPEQELLAHR